MDLLDCNNRHLALQPFLLQVLPVYSLLVVALAVGFGVLLGSLYGGCLCGVGCGGRGLSHKVDDALVVLQAFAPLAVLQDFAPLPAGAALVLPARAAPAAVLLDKPALR